MAKKAAKKAAKRVAANKKPKREKQDQVYFLRRILEELRTLNERAAGEAPSPFDEATAADLSGENAAD